MPRYVLLFFFVLFFPILLPGQTPEMNASQIALALQHLHVQGRVLYVAAHPDDENTRLIAYLATHKGYHTGYLSLTRGDGGQNLIGSEVREQLGLIRTQELIAARKIDGGVQFFSRANDFGFSKHPDETFAIWDREQVLADVVWTIRKFRPDVIITRFSPDRAGKTHGHHTASAQLAVEAFHAAADSSRFPEQLKYVRPWQAKRIFWNTSSWFYRNDPKAFEEAKKQLLSLDASPYNPLLGQSIGTIAALSRSMHRSQGFGAALQRGEEPELFQWLAGDTATHDLFEGINTHSNRYPNTEQVAHWIAQAQTRFTPAAPHRILPELLQAREALLPLLPQQPELDHQRQRLEALICAAAGIWADATTTSPTVAVGDSLLIRLRAINRSPVSIVIQQSDFGQTLDDTLRQMPNNQMISWQSKILLPDTLPTAQPYWLKKTGTTGMFFVDQQHQIGLAQNPPAYTVRLLCKIIAEGTDAQIPLELPVQYREVRPDEGERYQPLALVPPLTAQLENDLFLFANDSPQDLRLRVKSFLPKAQTIVRPLVPHGWIIQPSQQSIQLQGRGSEQEVSFRLIPPSEPSEDTLQILLETDKATYQQGFTRIDYPHIPNQYLLPTAQARLSRLDIQTRPEERIGYLMGAGDKIPEALRQIGYAVDLLQPETLTLSELQRYTTVIVGIRAYNTIPRLRFLQPSLMQFVEQGGNLIVQYNTSFGLVTDQLGPYPFKLSRDRVTVETAPMTLLKPDHPLLQSPNRLTDADFTGWVQERGLYFPNEWDERYTPIFSCHDPNEDPKQGALLVARYGKGTYIYTGLSFFRELPAGVTGAYRLFVNLISYR